MTSPKVRKQSKYIPLTKDEYRERFLQRYFDPAFDDVQPELDKVFERAWDGYISYRKAPRTRKAGPQFEDPDYDLSIEWLGTRDGLERAAQRHKDPSSPSRILVVNGSSRSEHSCPGEISKTLRLAQRAQQAIAGLGGFEVDLLNMYALTDEPMKVIHPCKACVSTAMPLCHWPCSCYPNHAMGQTNDWMAELYPRWVAAHGVFVLCPVNWYHAPASLKLMIDRLVCADGGNPDPTTTHGKDPALAKELELKGWPYPRHLAGRGFAVMTHGDAAGPEELRRHLADWLSDIGMIQAGDAGVVDGYIGYYEPYATGHEALDADQDIFIEVENAARSLAALVTQIRSGNYRAPDAGLKDPRPK